MKFMIIIIFLFTLSVNNLLLAQGDNISVYAGTFDTIDKEGDDKTNLIGIEHKNEDLFR